MMQLPVSWPARAAPAQITLSWSRRSSKGAFSSGERIRREVILGAANIAGARCGAGSYPVRAGAPIAFPVILLPLWAEEATLDPNPSCRAEGQTLRSAPARLYKCLRMRAGPLSPAFSHSSGPRFGVYANVPYMHGQDCVHSLGHVYTVHP